MEIKNTISNDFWSSFVIVKSIFDCRLSGVIRAKVASDHEYQLRISTLRGEEPNLSEFSKYAIIISPKRVSLKLTFYH